MAHDGEHTVAAEKGFQIQRNTFFKKPDPILAAADKHVAVLRHDLQGCRIELQELRAASQGVRKDASCEQHSCPVCPQMHVLPDVKWIEA
jgi:hypothetical protein